VHVDGRIKRGPRGEPIENPVPPVCERTPCRGPDNRPRLSAELWEIVELHNACKHFGSLPQAGGILDQDPLVMQLLCAVASEAEAVGAEQLKRAGERT
jgi:hypothetical protein